jgi:hypothetical protein
MKINFYKIRESSLSTTWKAGVTIRGKIFRVYIYVDKQLDWYNYEIKKYVDNEIIFEGLRWYGTKERMFAKLKEKLEFMRDSSFVDCMDG